MPTKCHVHNCTEPAIAKGLCRKHYMQVQRHGEVSDTRPADWGQREKHSAYTSWCGLRRSHRADMPKEWVDDFWKFAEDVGEKPKSSRAFRPYSDRPWGKDNFYWKEIERSSESVREYAKQWARNARAANPDYYTDQNLRKNYGVTLEWYQKTLADQNGVCAICKNPETTEIRGRAIAMAVDHCHTTHKARGLLCTQCNRALGLFRDDPATLQAAISYLEKFV
jgi:hypothetical protein